MDLVEKIRGVEVAIVGAAAEGEKRAAEFAKLRLEGKLTGEAIEYTVRLRNAWTKKLFVTLCHKYELETYRYAKQQHTTAMVRVSSSFLNGVLWPEFSKYDAMFQELAADIIKDLIAKIYPVGEVEEVVIAGDLPSTVSSTEMVAL